MCFFGISRIEKYELVAVRISVDPTITRLVRDVSAGIRVLQIRDGILLSESQILERARNIVMGLVGNYRIETLDRGRSVNGSAGVSTAAENNAIAETDLTGGAGTVSTY